MEHGAVAMTMKGPARIMFKSAIIYRGKLQAGMFLEASIVEADSHSITLDDGTWVPLTNISCVWSERYEEMKRAVEAEP
jgi:hypothetical protein